MHNGPDLKFWKIVITTFANTKTLFLANFAIESGSSKELIWHLSFTSTYHSSPEQIWIILDLDNQILSHLTKCLGTKCLGTKCLGIKCLGIKYLCTKCFVFSVWGQSVLGGSIWEQSIWQQVSPLRLGDVGQPYILVLLHIFLGFWMETEKINYVCFICCLHSWSYWSHRMVGTTFAKIKE